MPLYFAYGSNLDRYGMGARCPGAKAIGSACLVGHRFFIMDEGYASVRQDAGASVHGLLWDLPAADVPALDAYEETETGLYRRSWFDVMTNTGPVRAAVYEGLNRSVGVARPGYMEAVVMAAEIAGLPSRYCDELRAWLPRPV